ncbi:2-succinyl-5-enolpyruvyl-6-hydroxy-3-cyclohexene-1-carboxylic-acid synthase [Bacillus tianshenii]|uniref:2-succinyl-5-enolpyruvyl-6-hydroxy-3- cyclohexene-1-carboxylic-acid synthase n=1 Tax=Sutcliffiella tianshenii TaxID=1463404 RepID=UPI001CD632C1|nr:2-succinyl-5-enolpyruvyl-6-hydroxy-3-cyclohexene-1-carboxylic-acid synthase [Bacillus tianshenii]MCA1320008.1 2-succinyl-5-enolpyruvyl-6-hydroxy-3-cyclohexene-1-carboxylic-acid synthase [Bacillus tianshenii]
MKPSDDMTYYLAAFVDELTQSGMTDVVISPGSRSTPIALLMAEHPKLEVTVLIDERSASFYALGLAKTTGKPVALLCTSGTAAANYYPAIVEAYQARVPLLILTADRPHELRDIGAPQAIDQIKMYGSYVKWFVEMSLPADERPMIQYTRTMAARAIGTSVSAPRGPVHLNFPLREPLLPNLQAEGLWTKYGEANGSIVDVQVGSFSISEDQTAFFSQLFSKKKKGIIVCGEMPVGSEFPERVTELAEALQYPIFADPLSGLRTGSHAKEMICEGYDAFLREEAVKEALEPEVIIRFGAMPVSKFLMQYIARTTSADHIVIDGDGGWRDPTMQASYMVHCKEDIFCEKILALISPRKEPSWVKKIVSINERTKNILSSPHKNENMFEGNVITELQALLPQGSAIFVGNSMPIRDADTFFHKNDKDIKVLANRGANGIDGVVSTALAASNAYDRLVLVIGDLSFYHDMNGLLAAKLLKLDVTIVLINNNGGGIFSFLPQSKIDNHFETLFGTPMNMDFEHAARLYDANYSLVGSWDSFRRELSKSLSNKGLHIIEVPTNREENEQEHRKLWNSVSQEIKLSLSREI